MAAPIDRLVLKEARVIDPTQKLDDIATVYLEHGRIQHCVSSLSQRGPVPDGFKDATVVDASGMVAMPAFIDLRAHLGEPGFEYKEDVASGLRAAAAGGYCLVCCLPDTNPINDTRSITEFLLRAAHRAGGTALGPIGAVTCGLRGEELAEIGDLREAGAVAVSDAGHYIRRADLLRRALQYCETFDVLLMQQPLEPSLVRGTLMHEGSVSTRLGLRGSPGVAEAVALQRDLTLAATTRARYHASTLSTEGSINLIRDAKGRGARVSCDITPYHLLLNHAAVDGFDSRYKIVPPLREQKDQAALLEGLNDGTIDCIVSDHRPQSAVETDTEFDMVAAGMSGLELTISLLWQCVADGRIALSRIAELLSTGPARVLGLPAPSFKPGEVANFALVDPSRRFVPGEVGMHSKSQNTPYLNQELQAAVALTVSNGRVVYTLKEGL